MNDASQQRPLHVRKRAQALVALACALGLGYVFAEARAQAWLQAQQITLARDTGWLALSLLLCALCVTPLGRALALVRRRPQVATPAFGPQLRRALGIASATFSALHAALSFSGLLGASLSLVWSWPHLRAGALALGILLALLLTSFPRLVQRVRLRTWKELHRLAYVAALLVLLHVLLSPFAPRGWVLLLYAAVGGVGCLRLLPQRSSAMPDSAQKRSSTAA